LLREKLLTTKKKPVRKKNDASGQRERGVLFAEATIVVFPIEEEGKMPVGHEGGRGKKDEPTHSKGMAFRDRGDVLVLAGGEEKEERL